MINDEYYEAAKEFLAEALERIKAVEEHSAIREAAWEKMREQRDNARARVVYLEREMNVLRTEKELRK